MTIDGSGFLPFNQNNVDLLDTVFNPGSGVDIWINSIILQANNKILISGNFTKYNNVSRNHIAKLNPDGSLESTFNPDRGANFLIWTTTLQPDGKILIGGYFIEYNGTPRSRLARLNPDGSLDPSFNPKNGASGIIRAVTVQSDSKILIGGDFTEYNGTPRKGIVRINQPRITALPTVTIGGNNFTNVVLVSSRQLTCIIPPNTKGTEDVVVINSAGQQATLANGFTYIDIGPLISGDILS